MGIYGKRRISKQVGVKRFHENKLSMFYSVH
jgi:hypothetical protein